jgi:hypothetical protein
MRLIPSNSPEHNPESVLAETSGIPTSTRWAAQKLICSDGSIWIARDTWSNDYRGHPTMGEREATALATKLNEAEDREAAARAAAKFPEAAE